MQVRERAVPLWSSEEVTYLKEFFAAILPAATADPSTGTPEAAVAGAMNVASLAVKAFMAEKAKMKG